LKVLLDACVWGGAVADLTSSGHDVLWAGAWAEDPGDAVLLSRAHQDGRVLVTLDKDFGELAIVHGLAHSGIVRLVGARAREQGRLCCEVLAHHGAVLSAGAIVTAEPGRTRVRPPPGAK